MALWGLTDSLVGQASKVEASGELGTLPSLGEELHLGLEEVHVEPSTRY